MLICWLNLEVYTTSFILRHWAGADLAFFLPGAHFSTTPYLQFLILPPPFPPQPLITVITSKQAIYIIAYTLSKIFLLKILICTSRESILITPGLKDRPCMGGGGNPRQYKK